MDFYGLTKSTLLDYPGRVSCVIFTKGCNLRCPFCHNKELVDERYELDPYTWTEIEKHLIKRKNVISGVCISGGEPLLYADELSDIIDHIHELGFKVKLDTNGLLYDRLIEQKVDFIAMDIKTSLDKYNLVCNKFSDKMKQNILNSINYIMSCGIDYEFRTTVAPNIVTMDDIKNILSLIPNAKKYALAQFRPKNTLSPEFESVVPYSNTFFDEAKTLVENSGINCEVRIGY